MRNKSFINSRKSEQDDIHEVGETTFDVFELDAARSLVLLQRALDCMRARPFDTHLHHGTHAAFQRNRKELPDVTFTEAFHSVFENPTNSV